MKAFRTQFYSTPFLLFSIFSCFTSTAQVVTNFQLRNANTDAIIRELADGEVIDLNLDGNDLAVSADAIGVGSVRFVLSGAQSLTRTESAAPYALHGDVSGDYNIWNPTLGSYMLVATAFSGAGASGVEGPALVVNFSVINSAVPPPTGGSEFIESGGLVIMEAESQPVVGDWDLNTDIAGFTGTHYIEWKTGDPFAGAIPAGTDIITYDILISTPGRYRMQIRSAAPDRTEHNDVWVAFPDNGALKEKAGVYTDLGTGFFKVYQNVDNDTWTWNSSNVDGNPHNIYTDFPAAGTYRFQFSGRSTKFKIDRIALYAAGVSGSFALNLSRPESQRNTTIAADDVASTLEDTEVIIAVLSNDSTNFGALDLASVMEVVSPAHGNLLFNPDGSITYSPESGYFGLDSFVYRVCNTFGACSDAQVNVTIDEVIDPPVCDVPVNLTATILSPTSAMLSWDPVLNADGYQFQGRRIGSSWTNRGTTNTSLTFSIFNPGDTYQFRVRAFCNGTSIVSDFAGIQSFTMPLARGNASMESTLTLAPNPATDYVDIRIALSDDVQDVAMFDLTGQLVASWTLHGDTRVDISHLPSGSYFIQSSVQGQAVVQMQKLMIVR